MSKPNRVERWASVRPDEVESDGIPIVDGVTSNEYPPERGHRNARLVELPPGSVVVTRELLVALEFSVNGKCPICVGWNVEPNGETAGKHTRDCTLKAALRATKGRKKS